MLVADGAPKRETKETLREEVSMNPSHISN